MAKRSDAKTMAKRKDGGLLRRNVQLNANTSKQITQVGKKEKMSVAELLRKAVDLFFEVHPELAKRPANGRPAYARINGQFTHDQLQKMDAATEHEINLSTAEVVRRAVDLYMTRSRKKKLAASK